VDFEGFVTKIMRDDKFRAALKADPKAALADHGIDATPEMVHAINNLDWQSMQKVSDHYKAVADVSC
jgi:hypothetical protein